MSAFDQNKYIQQYRKEHYQRIPLDLPAGARDVIRARAQADHKSVNQYIGDLILWDLGYKDWSQAIKNYDTQE